MLIMTNARGSASRIKLALQVKHSLLDSMEENNVDLNSDKATQLIFHLARLKKPYRVLFGKSLFKAMSKLYKLSEKDKGHGRRSSRNSSSKVQEKRTSSESTESDGLLSGASPASAVLLSSTEEDTCIPLDYQSTPITSLMEV
jgi:hypothetical protein